MLVACLAVLATSAAATGEVALAAPNAIVFVMVDDFGWSDLGLHVNPEAPTPTMDSLAHSDILLDNCYIFKYCAPSRAMLLTGRVPGHGISEANYGGSAEIGVNLNLTMLPAKLKQSTTCKWPPHQIGKWHAGEFSRDYLPVSRGFDTSYGYLSGAVTHFTQLFPQYNAPQGEGGHVGQLGVCQGVDSWNTSENAWR